MKTKTTITTTIISENGIPDDSIPWSDIVSNLHARYSLRKLAVKLSCDEKTLSHIKNGESREPKFSLGVNLIAIHSLYCPNEHRLMEL